MKTNYNVFKAVAIALLVSCSAWSQATIAQWNFNGTSATDVAGGADSPSTALGSGTAQLVGGTTATFASGNSTAGTLETETTSPPNYGWNSTGYPATANAGNRTAGVQFNVSTVGQAGIIFRFEQRLSNTSANTYVVQYTADVTAPAPVWTDAQTFTFTPAATGTGDTWYNSRIVDVSTVTALDNNPNVAFRILSDFDPVAGTFLAARSTSTYAGGTVRFDMVTVTSNVTLATTQFEIANKQFSVYPNPAAKEIVNLSEPQDIRVYDIAGKLVLEAKNAATIDARSFVSGVYFVQTASGATQKLIVR